MLNISFHSKKKTQAAKTPKKLYVNLLKFGFERL